MKNSLQSFKKPPTTETRTEFHEHYASVAEVLSLGYNASHW